jgi:HPt (histidine-containing phosphotransfer) domain-containing protein
MGRNEPRLGAAPPPSQDASKTRVNALMSGEGQGGGETVESRLAALKMRFRERAMTEARALELMIDEVQCGLPELEVQGEIRRIAHSLCGGGGTFGYAAISARAAELEELVLDHPDSPELSAACRALVAEIRRATAGAAA